MCEIVKNECIGEGEEGIVIILMRVNKIAIRKQTNAEYDKVILKLESPFEDFL